MDSKELLQCIINDMDNSILSYREMLSSVNDRDLKIVFRVRINELQDWCQALKNLLNALD